MIIPVILSGGSGHRLWPLSRETCPKQFQKLHSDVTLLQLTAKRLRHLGNMTDPIIICNHAHRFLALDQLNAIDVKAQEIILEPVGRNTAPAIAVAAFAALEKAEDPALLIMPSDQFMQEPSHFYVAIAKSQASVANGHLVAFGIQPQYAHTGYGYIQANEKISEGVWRIAQFTEKPNRVLAEKYLRAGNYYWNSGIFFFKAAAYLQQLEQYAPDIFKQCKETMKFRRQDLHFTLLDQKSFGACRKESIDYAIMEKIKNAVVVAMDAKWNDIGSWASLDQIAKKDEYNNAFVGDVFAEDVHDSYIQASNRLIAALGVNNQIIVETKDAILIADKSRSEDVKKIVAKMQDQDRKEVKMHQRVYRPWGYYETLIEGEKFQVKRIVVQPGAALSLQMHHHRSEHWVVVRGQATVVRGEEKFLLNTNQSTYIPVKVMHRLSNECQNELEIIEVQSGDYLGEDDIVRFADKYART